MFVHRSNRLEALSDALAKVVEAPLSSPLASEVVVVASQGIERWISERLAARFGVWANARFPFPRAFMNELLGASDEDDAYDREALAFALAELLPGLAKEPDGREIARYLEGDQRDVKRFDLATKLAKVFDQYFVYRPQLVRTWKEGKGRGFQPALLRRAVEKLGNWDLGARAERFFANPLPPSVPERISIFGVSALPPIYVKILARVARERDVHVFLLRASPAERSETHPLAASLGASGTEFEQLLLESSDGVRVVDAFIDPGTKTLLAALQSDLLAARPRSPEIGAPRALARPGDTSITIHSCHSPLREVEVLRDQLLARFEADPTLEPHHVAVMTPKLDEYAPLVEAVFGGDPSLPGFIPHRVFDRKPSTGSTVAEVLFRLLDLAGSRMKASTVLDLFDLAPVQERFDIGPEQLFDLRRLVSSSGIRWGFDEAHRESFGQPARVENTFRFGLRRLLLGQAMSADVARPFHGVLPMETDEESGALVGTIASACRALQAWNEALAHPKTVGEWALVLPKRLEAFVSVDGTFAHELRAVVDSIRRVAEHAARGGFGGTLHREALALLLQSEIDRDESARHFLSGKVTVSALLPMRSIPFRVVYLLGMSDVNFPRRSRAPFFDLVAHRPAPGDRSIRDEDRLLFLEAFLSARDQFSVSYVGHAVQDNAPFPPSVVVAELVEALDAGFTTTKERPGQLAFSFTDARVSEDGIGQSAVVRHPLQPWSERYFKNEDARLVSFSGSDAEGAAALATRMTLRPRFHAAPLLGRGKDTVTIDELARFFENPARGLLEKRLGLSLYDNPLLIADREAMEIRGLDGYEVGRALFSRFVERGPFMDASEFAGALGLVPPGTLGEVDLTEVLGEVRSLVGVVRKWRDVGPVAPVEVEVDLEPGQLRGYLHDVFPRGQLVFRYVRLKPKTELATWVRHLALQMATDAPRTTVVGGRSLEGHGVELRVFEPLDEAEARRHLAALVSLYQLGQKAPLCLFPSASKQFVSKWLDAAGKPDRENLALQDARRTFSPKGRRDARGPEPEREDAYVRRLFDSVDPFSAAAPFDEDGALGLPNFATLSRAVFEPLLAHSRVESE